MYRELIYVACSREGCDAELQKVKGVLCYEVTGSGIALFSNHSQALLAGLAAGWLMMSEDLGGDVCPKCHDPKYPTAEEIREVAREIGVELGVVFGDDKSRAEYKERTGIEVYDPKFEEHLEAEAELDDQPFPAGPWGLSGPIDPRHVPIKRDGRERDRSGELLSLGEMAELEDVRRVWKDKGLSIGAEYKCGAYRWSVRAGHHHGAGFKRLTEREFDSEQAALNAAYNAFMRGEKTQ